MIRFWIIVLLLSLFIGYCRPVQATEAKLTEVHGKVYKRGFIDYIRRILADPIQAKLNDILTEGMQLGTGDNAWAQLTWPNVVARAWSNTILQIVPGKKIIYLAQGEALVSKRKGSSEDISIWTKVLHARMRGTTVLFQQSGEVSTVSCLEGNIEVENTVDHSITNLGPGMVYEVQFAGSKKPKEKKHDEDSNPFDDDPDSDKIGQNKEQRLKNIPANFHPVSPDIKIVRSDVKQIDLFDTGKTRSLLKVLDADKARSHPLLKNIESQDLIEKAFEKLPDVCYPKRKIGDQEQLIQRNKLAYKSSQVTREPSGDFKAGGELGYRYSMPSPVSAGFVPKKVIPQVVRPPERIETVTTREERETEIDRKQEAYQKQKTGIERMFKRKMETLKRQCLDENDDLNEGRFRRGREQIRRWRAKEERSLDAMKQEIEKLQDLQDQGKKR